MTRPSMLLVEDHKEMAEALTNVLHKKGNLEVSDVAETAEEALVCLSERQVDLALVDIVLSHAVGERHRTCLDDP